MLGHLHLLLTPCGYDEIELAYPYISLLPPQANLPNARDIALSLKPRKLCRRVPLDDWRKEISSRGFIKPINKALNFCFNGDTDPDAAGRIGIFCFFLAKLTIK